MTRSTQTQATAPIERPAAKPARKSPADTRVPGCNIAVALGSISSEVQMRSLPSGTDVASFSISVSHSTGPATSLPVSWSSPPPAMLARFEPGVEVLAIGRIVRRFYRSGGSTQSRTELVVDRIERLSRRVACRRMVEQVIGHLEATVAERLI